MFVRDIFLGTVATLAVGVVLGAGVIPGRSSAESPPSVSVVSARVRDFSHLNGKIIRGVDIRIRPVFDDPGQAFIYQAANDVKASSKVSVVRRELLMKQGEPYDDFARREAERHLRELRYLRNVTITPVADGDSVDLHVEVQDVWTLIPQVSYSSGTGRSKRSIGLAESNFGGFGKRGELLYEEDEGRESIEAVYQDDRVFNSQNVLVLGFFDRTDGQRTLFSLGRPFRTVLEPSSWEVSTDNSDSIGRLFSGGEERYIFRQQADVFGSRYTVALGDPLVQRRRYSFGVDYRNWIFDQADLDDYNDLNLDPNEVSNDLADLPEDRRFVGPVFNFESIEPDFLPMNYVDRFDRIEDYNLGRQYSFNFFVAPSALGSTENALLMSANRARGWRFAGNAFLRGEVGVATRAQSDGLRDSLLRLESKYYNVLGVKRLGGVYLGKHTLAGSFFVDYGHNLDKDREFLVGGDNVLRGYEAKSFYGDKRFGLNLEDRVHVAEDVFRLMSVGLAAFVDVGGATTRSISELFADEVYSDVGVGLRFAFPRSSGGSVVRVDLAFPLRDGPDGSNAYELRIIFGGGQLFNSRLRSESLGAENASVAVGFDR